MPLDQARTRAAPERAIAVRVTQDATRAGSIGDPDSADHGAGWTARNIDGCGAPCVQIAMRVIAAVAMRTR